MGTGKTSGTDYLGLDLDVVGGLLQLEVPFALGDLGVVQKPESRPGKDEHGAPSALVPEIVCCVPKVKIKISSWLKQTSFYLEYGTCCHVMLCVQMIEPSMT